MASDPDYRELTHEQLVARLQIATSENRHLKEANVHLHRMIETLRDAGWATPRPLGNVEIHDYPMQGQAGGDRVVWAKKLADANQRADHWRKQYMELLDATGRKR